MCGVKVRDPTNCDVPLHQKGYPQTIDAPCWRWVGHSACFRRVEIHAAGLLDRFRNDRLWQHGYESSSSVELLIRLGPDECFHLFKLQSHLISGFQSNEKVYLGNCMYFAKAILIGGVVSRRLLRVGCCVNPRVGFSRRRLNKSWLNAVCQV